ncbi:MAG: sugar phosphate nucleotidyltransferase [Candidatus Zixiibacteriota bacterium]
MIYGVVLAGGKGERFWPLSRQSRPKQFLRLTSERTMLEETIDRVLPMIPRDNIRIVTSDSMGRFILSTMPELEDKNLLTEPVGRNTCVAIGLAAVHIAKSDPDGVMVVLSADHLIRPQEKLLQILDTGCSIAAKEDYLITIGVVPTRPETAYGYVRLGEIYRQDSAGAVYKVSGFTEKPKAALAHEYYYSHKYLWNSGMFIWSAKSILSAVKTCMPETFRILEEYSLHIGTPRESQAREELYNKAVAISIDFAVLEKATNVLTIKGDIVWDDVGSWRALERYKERDSDANIVVGESILLDTYETTVYNNADGVIVCLGLSDLIIVRTENITMVAHKTQAENIKKILGKLNESDKTQQYL